MKSGIEEKEPETNEFWENKGYDAYKAKHGMHFSEKLATFASKNMQNADGKSHMWSLDDVKGAFSSFGFQLKNGYTFADATYAANMIYADYGQYLKADTDAVKMAYALITDPDGYEGMIFNRYTADIMAKNIEIDWEEMT